MVHASNKKLFPWSKHTNYASIASERRPSETGQSTLVTSKHVDMDLSEQRDTLTKLERKSISLLDGQRKALEKSMLKYTEKVREIRDTKTNSLFREIHTRQSQRHSLSDTRSLAQSCDSHDAFSLPVDSANIRKRKKRLHKSRKAMFPPIVENLSRNGKRNSLPSHQSSEFNNNHVTKSTNKNTMKDSQSEQNDTLDFNNDPVLTSRNVKLEISEIDIDNDRLQEVPTRKAKSTTSNKPMISIELDNDSFAVGGDTNAKDHDESGYASAVDDDREDYRSYAPSISCQSEPYRRDELLILPRIHKRRAFTL